MCTLIIIPARKGSQRLKRKNKKLFLGKPLIQHTIDFAKKAREIYFKIADEEVFPMPISPNPITFDPLTAISFVIFLPCCKHSLN